MIVVADTSPLNYLILIGHIDVLDLLYGSIAIPQAVYTEMLRDLAPPQVRSWAANLPSWIHVRHAAPALHLSPDLDQGELEAISLALALKAPALLIDERIGRNEAQAAGLKVIGTLGILRDAHTDDLLDLGEALQRLRTTNFRIASSVLTELGLRD